MEQLRRSFGSDTEVLPTASGGKYHKVKNRYSLSNSGGSVLFTLINILLGGSIVCIVTMHHVQYSTLQKEYNSIQKNIDNIMSSENEHASEMQQRRKALEQRRDAKRATEKSVTELKKVLERSEKEKDDLKKELEEHVKSRKDRVGKTIGLDGEVYSDEKIERREAQMENRLETLHGWVQMDSHREVMERFGPGPHRVRFDVSLPSPDRRSNFTMPGSFVVEVAPVDLVPHAVHLFLEQVYHHLWDGCSFLLKSPHSIYATPYYDVDLNDEYYYARFHDMELDTLAIQEYSPEYPHETMTLGFAGRPGGPDFYINMEDNTHRYGPGANIDHDLEEEGDPAFAKVIMGEDIVRKIFNNAARETQSHAEFFYKPVRIKTATLIGIKPDQYRHTFYEKGYYEYHQYQYYEEKKQMADIKVKESK